MATKLIYNIKSLVNVRVENQLLFGAALAELPAIENAFLIIEDGMIADFGSMSGSINISSFPKDQLVDAQHGFVLPTWCDSHTHLVFAGAREMEFVDKIKGLTYEQINERGGGILNSSKLLNATSEDELFRISWARLQEVISMGTGAIEIKSGYGLNVEGELKMLRVIKKLKEKSSVEIRSTFLGAHSFPTEYRQDHDSYIKILIEELLPVIAKEKLADYIDVFCEKGFFSPQESDVIIKAGLTHGLKPKMHVNQINSIGGIETGIRNNAISLDHLESLTETDIDYLSNRKITMGGKPWKGICTLLPTAAFFLRMPFQPARALIDAGCAVSIASDYNPGSSPSGNMQLVISMSCIQMKMLPEEAINAATINSSFAMGAQDKVGSITKGKNASLIFTKPVPSLAYIPYAFGQNHINKVMINGEFV